MSENMARVIIDDLDEGSTELMAYLNSHPLFARLAPAARSKAFTHCYLIKAKEEEVILEREGEPAENIYIIVSGSVHLMVNEALSDTLEMKHRVLNTDASLLRGRVEKTSVLQKNSTVLAVPKTFFLDLELNYPNLLKRLMHPTVIGRDDDEYDAVTDLSTEVQKGHIREVQDDTLTIDELEADEINWRKYLGYILTFLLPALTYYVTKEFEISAEEQLFFVVFSSAAVMWFFDIVPHFIPAAFLLTAVLSIGIVPIEVILKGFASDGFIILMSTYSIGSAILITGLGHRMMLKFFFNFGSCYKTSTGALFGAGGLLTPLMPSIVARTDVVTPIYTEARETLRLEENSQGALHLALMIYYGVNLFSSVFISGSVLNYLILSLFPEAMSDQFSWITWFEASSVFGVVMLTGFWLLQKTSFKKIQSQPINKKRLEGQLKIMGPITPHEKTAAAAAIVFILGVLTSAIHKIDVAWIALFSLFILLFFRVLTQEAFRKRVDWPFLIMLATTIGVADSFKHLGIDTKLLNLFTMLTGGDMSKFEFIAICALIAIILAKLLPLGPAIILGATITVPLAHLHYVHPFVIGFIVLIANEMWGGIHKSPLFEVFCNRVKLGEKLPFEERGFIQFQHKLNVLRVVGLLASLPYWIWLGLI